MRQIPRTRYQKKIVMMDDLIKTYQVLDSIDIMSFLKDKPRDYNVCDLMNDLDKSVKTFSSNSFLLMDDYFQGELFNQMCEDEFIDYLRARYGNKLRFRTTITNYLSIA